MKSVDRCTFSVPGMQLAEQPPRQALMTGTGYWLSGALDWSRIFFHDGSPKFGSFVLMTRSWTWPPPVTGFVYFTLMVAELGGTICIPGVGAESMVKNGFCAISTE